MVLTVLGCGPGRKISAGIQCGYRHGRGSRKSSLARIRFCRHLMACCSGRSQADGVQDGCEGKFSTMTAETFFQVTNTLALVAWIGLVLFPGKKLFSGWLCAVVVPAALALAYACVIGWKFATNGPPPGEVMTLTGLRKIFEDDWVFAAAWTHYLVFDMVVGAWIARDSVKLGLPGMLRTVALVLTFLAGPVGFLVHILGRAGLRRTGAVE